MNEGKAALARIASEARAPRIVDWDEHEFDVTLRIALNQLQGKSTSSRGEALLGFMHAASPEAIRSIAAYVAELEGEVEQLKQAAALSDLAQIDADMI